MNGSSNNNAVAGSSTVNNETNESTDDDDDDDAVVLEQQPGRVEIALAEAQRDLDNAEFHLGFLFDPLRHIVLRPALNIATQVLPPVTKVIPFADEVTAFGLNIPFNVARKAYGMTHSEQATAQWKTYHQANQEFQQFTERKVAEEIIRQKSEWTNMKGFMISTTIEILSDPVSNLKAWTKCTQQLLSYLESAGITDELNETIQSDKYLLNVRILAHIQAIEENTPMRRFKIAIPGATFSRSPHVIAKLMRYCCAAYGKEMMEATDIIAERKNDGGEMSEKYKSLVGSEALKQQVCDHVGIPVHYISYFCMGHGGSMKLLRHYISTDHELSAVVLVIRGTYSVSGWHIDFQGQGAEFCGGIAHSGISAMASAIMENSRDETVAALDRYPTYKLIITGQSLGGGCSPLVNILCHTDPVIGKRQIECHAFAGPPVYYSDNTPALVQKAISHCTHYVHGDDIVPYLSVHSVRRVNAKLEALDRVVKKTSLVDSTLVSVGRKTPTSDMVMAGVYGDAAIQPVAGAPNLMTPAKEVVWFLEDEEADEINFMVCDTKEYSELGILVSQKSFSDHVPPKYEVVLNKAEECGWRQLDFNFL